MNSLPPAASQGKRRGGLLPITPSLRTPGAAGSGLSPRLRVLTSAWSPASQGISPDRSPGHLSLAGQDQRRSALSRRLRLSHKPGAWRAEQCKLSSSQVARSYETPAAGPPDRPRTGKEQEPEPHSEAEPPVPPGWAGRERHTRSKGGWRTWWVGLGARAAEPRIRGGGPTPTSPSFLRLKPRHPPK